MNRQNVLDRVFGMVLGKTPFFSGGFGDFDMIEHLVKIPHDHPGVPEIEVRWVGEPTHYGNVTGYVGMFTSPLAHELDVPGAVRTAFFELLVPSAIPEDVDLPICIHLAATSDQGFGARRRLALPLVREGIGALILENPYYGWRRPKHQRYIAPNTLADQLLMNMATVQEARGLLGWLRRHGFRRLGVTGYSMGGFGTAYTAALTDFPIAAIPCAAGADPAFAFTGTEFERVIDWESLSQDANEREIEDVRGLFVEIFSKLSLDLLPKPNDPDCAVIIAARHDAVVPPEQAMALSEHWGVPVRWIEAGHINGIWRGYSAYRSAILDAFALLLAKHG